MQTISMEYKDLSSEKQNIHFRRMTNNYSIIIIEKLITYGEIYVIFSFSHQMHFESICRQIENIITFIPAVQPNSKKKKKKN